MAVFSRFFVDNLDGADVSASGITTQSITHALARRSDVWELTRLRGKPITLPERVVYELTSEHTGPILARLRQVTALPGLQSAEDVLYAVSATVKASKVDEARRSLEAQTLLATAKLFRAIGERIPSEYLDMATKGSLTDSALALDLWLSSEHGISAEADRASAQSDLRHFVLADGTSTVRLCRIFDPSHGAQIIVPQVVTPALASQVVASTSDSARDVTVALCRKLVFACVPLNCLCSPKREC